MREVPFFFFFVSFLSSFFISCGNFCVSVAYSQGHQVFVEALAYDASSDRFFSGDRDGRILAFDTQSARNSPFTGAKHASKILGTMGGEFCWFLFSFSL
jgi:hypothetical protein